MKLVGLMPVRNEAWILGLSLRVALAWCDELVVLDHASTDRTPDMLRIFQVEFGSRLTVLRLDNPDWDEMGHRQLLLDTARERGATHIAIVDADEVLTANLHSDIRGAVESMPQASILQLPGYNLRGGLQYHSNGIWGHRWFSMIFCDNPRLHWGGDRFHHREPMGMYLNSFHPVPQQQGGILHFWGFCERRLKAKHALYKITEAVKWPEKPRVLIDQLYNLAFVPSANPAFDQQWKFAEVPAEWIEGLPLLSVLPDEEPWQEAECRRSLRQYGSEFFWGLNLFGMGVAA